LTTVVGEDLYVYDELRSTLIGREAAGDESYYDANDE